MGFVSVIMAVFGTADLVWSYSNSWHCSKFIKRIFCMTCICNAYILYINKCEQSDGVHGVRMHNINYRNNWKFREFACHSFLWHVI